MPYPMNPLLGAHRAQPGERAQQARVGVLLKFPGELGALDVLHHAIGLGVQLGNVLPEAVHRLLQAGRGGLGSHCPGLAAYIGKKTHTNF